VVNCFKFHLWKHKKICLQFLSHKPQYTAAAQTFTGKQMAITSPVLPTINPLYRRPIVEQATGDSRTTIYRKIKAGLFTKPVKIGGDRVAWPANEIQAINQARIAGKSDEEIKALVIELEAARQRSMQ
jgi:prophage regulatory protein